MSDADLMPRNRLVLFPQQADSQPVLSVVIIDQLSELGLIGKSLQPGESTYLPGPEFMRLITFLGCSPVVSMGERGEGDNDGPNQYFIEVSDVNDSVVAICGVNKTVPYCPECRHKPPGRNVSDDAVDTVLSCDQCGFESSLYLWDWHHQAGFGRHWISIQGVHEGEAAPGEKLLNTLHKLSGLAWNYAWCRDP